jgi:FemAB-related protein (PEP-CTERM system-associated)
MTTVRRADLASPADCAAIDVFLDGHPDATPFHRRAWVEAVTRGCGHKAHYLIAGDGAVTGVVPLHEVHSMLFGRALVSSGFAVAGGILANDPASVEVLGEAAWALAGQTSCPTLEMRGGALPEHWTQDTTTYLNFARDLASDDEAELLAIPRKQRAEVRKALGNDLTVDVGRSGADRAAHYAVYAESVRNLGTPVFPRSLFEAVFDGFGDDADLLTVRKNGVPLASVLSLYHRGTVMPYWGGGTAGARPARANDMMYFTLMRHARERGCTRFDFGRSKAGTGAAAFKHNWGFEGVPLAYAKRAVGKAREINPLNPQYSRKVQLWQKLPLPIANLVGPIIARGLG